MGLPVWYWGSAIFLMGACLGSLANVIIYRWPRGENFVTPRSHCYFCKKTIPFYLNIPILSWFLLRGRCYFCKAPFSIRYAMVELLMGVLFLSLYLRLGPQWFLLEVLVFAFGAVTSSFIDLDHYLLPDMFTLSGIVIGFGGALLNPERHWQDSLLGILFGGGFLWAIAYIYYLIRKQEGMGGGDIKLLAWIGALLGWKAIPFVILSSSLLGTFIGLLVMLRSRQGLKTVIPFGPYLVLGALLYIYLGEEIGLWYPNFWIPGLVEG